MDREGGVLFFCPVATLVECVACSLVAALDCLLLRIGRMVPGQQRCEGYVVEEGMRDDAR